MHCPACGHESPEAARFCGECGSSLERRCPACTAANPPTNKFCFACGKALVAPPGPASVFAPPRSYTPPHLAEKILTARGALEGERKQVTVLFCDLVNSTPLAERLGPEGMHGLLNRFFELALAEVHRYEGTVNQFLGDGFMALFGAPVAHEDHARRAVLAALGLQRRLQEEWTAGEGPHLRMGLNTGPVVVGAIGDNLRMDYTAVGDTTNVAARLQTLAEPNVILMSGATARPVRGYVRMEEQGPAHLKGKHEPVTVYRVVGLGPRRSPLEGLEERALSPFVGRGRELATLQELLEQAEGGQGQVVGLVAEPGMGKSRLLLEFRRSLAGRRVTYLEGRCLSYGGAIPYLPVLDILRNNCGIVETDSAEVIGEKVRFALQEVGMDVEEAAPYLLQLVGVKDGTERLSVLSPEAVKARTFETVRQMSLRGSRRRPLILAVEDLHWIDKTSEEFFASLVESLAGAPILLLCTYRPGYRPPWLEHSYVTQIAVRRLAPADSLSVVRAVLQAEEVPDPLARVILDKAEGNPFFLEELARAVVEHGDLRSDAAVPDTIQGVLMARIDRLPDEPRRALQTASVLGREFSLRLLGAIWDGPGVLEPHLLELKRLEFLYEQTSAEEPVYVFKHALTQDVAYDSLLLSRQQALHAAAGRALEVLYADRLEDVYDRLGYHFSKTEQAAKAVEYLTLFAEKAARSYAHADVVTALEEARLHAERLSGEVRDRRIVDLVLRLAQTYYFLGRMPDTLTLLLEQQERLERLDDPTLAGPYYFWLSHTYSYVSDLDRAIESAERAIREAARCGDEATLGKAHYVLARSRGFWLCYFVEGVEHGRQAVELLERTQEWLWLGQSYWAMALSYEMMGEFELGLEATARGHAIGEATGDVRVQTYTDWMSGWLHATRGDWEAGIDACQRSLARSRDMFNTTASTGWLGYAYLEKGDPAQAIPLLEEARQSFDLYGYRGAVGLFTGWLSEALFLDGQLARARAVASKGLDIARSVENWWGVAASQSVLGQIALARHDLAEAQVHLDEAFQTFAAINARFDVGKTHLTLARLSHAKGEHEAAVRHLRQAQDLFTELRAPRYLAKAAWLAADLDVQLPS